MSTPMSVRGKLARRPDKSLVCRVSGDASQATERPSCCLITDHLSSLDEAGDWAAILTTETLVDAQNSLPANLSTPIVHSLPHLDHLVDGDVVAISPRGEVRTLYRIQSDHNSLLVAESCNSYCLMCSQPPRLVDDRARMDELLRLVELIDPATRALGLTGGEPTLLKGDLIRLVERCKELLPQTSLHLLSNGRLFYYGSYARDLAAVNHRDLMIAVPLYADIDFIHDFVVQERGAFQETLVGLHNLARYGLSVELRVVLHRQSFKRLPELAEFIKRNLPFVSQVALMGLEIMGFAVPNLDDLWIDPLEYQLELDSATSILANSGLRVMIYNHQLCVLPERLWPYAVKSISDWKNEYLPVCTECGVRDQCGGFFSSGVARRHSEHIEPLPFLPLPSVEGGR